jgi:precorrin-6B methylase 2
VLKLANPQQGECFVDIGSGSGKAVLLAAHCFPFEKAYGIEIMESLHEAAEQALAAYSACTKQQTSISFQRNDAFAVKWESDADIVFAPTTCYTDEMYAKMLKQAERLREGARLIVSTRPINNPKHFEQVEGGRFKYYRGSLEFYVYRKISPPRGGE